MTSTYSPQIPKPSPEAIQEMLVIVNGPENEFAEKLGKIENPIGMLKGTLKELTEAIKNAHAMIFAQNGMIESQRVQLEELSKKKEVLTGEVNDLDSIVNAALTEGRKLLARETEAKNKQVTDLNSEIEDKNFLRTALQNEIKTLTKSCEQESKVYGNAKAFHTSEMERFNAEKVAKQRELAALDDNLAQSQAMFEFQFGKIKGLEKDKLHLDELTSSGKAILEALFTEIDAAKSKLAALASEAKEYEIRAFIVTQREKVVEQRKIYIQGLYAKAGVTYPKDPTDSSP